MANPFNTGLLIDDEIDAKFDAKELQTRDFLDDTRMGRMVRSEIKDSREDMSDLLPTQQKILDSGFDFVNGITRKGRSLIPMEMKSSDNVALLQTARANFINELNKFNVEIPRGFIGQQSNTNISQPNQNTLREFLFQQTGREPEVMLEDENRDFSDETRPAG